MGSHATQRRRGSRDRSKIMLAVILVVEYHSLQMSWHMTWSSFNRGYQHRFLGGRRENHSRNLTNFAEVPVSVTPRAHNIEKQSPRMSGHKFSLQENATIQETYFKQQLGRRHISVTIGAPDANRRRQCLAGHSLWRTVMFYSPWRYQNP